MAHAQKPDLVFQRNGRVHLNRQGCQFSRLLAVEECGSADSDCIDRVPTYRARLLAAHSIRIFPLHFPSHVSPCAIRFRTCYKTNQMHQCVKFILFKNDTTCFGRSFVPSSGVHDCTYSNGHMSNSGISVWHMPVAVYTVMNFWWWTERPSKTCGVSFQNKINLRHWCM